MTHILWKWLARIVIFSWAFGLVLVAFWQLYPYQVSEVHTPIKILNDGKVVTVGEPVIQELKIHKPNDIPPQDVSRTILCDSGNLVLLTQVTARNLPVGTYTVINDKYILPPKVLDGDTCVFVWRQGYRVNPIKVIKQEWKSEKFNVKE
jgi:hypothetical protein